MSILYIVFFSTLLQEHSLIVMDTYQTVEQCKIAEEQLSRRILILRLLRTKVIDISGSMENVYTACTGNKNK